MSYPSPTIMPDRDSMVKVLQNSTKFKAFFNGFGFAPVARLEMTKTIMAIVEIHQEAYIFADGLVLRIRRDEFNAITFANADQGMPFPPQTNPCM